jgi:hypothetical protein
MNGGAKHRHSSSGVLCPKQNLLFYKVVNKMTRAEQSAALVILFIKVGLLNFVTFEILCLNIFGVS